LCPVGGVQKASHPREHRRWAEGVRYSQFEVVLVLRDLSETDALREEAIRVNNYVDTGARLYNRDIPEI
jgi:hypothetical protein